MADGSRYFDFPAPSRSRSADLLSGLRANPSNVPLNCAHPQLHRITLVTDHTLDAHLDSNAVHGGRVQENVIHLAGDGQQETVTLDHAPHRSVVATSLHRLCGLVGVRQFTLAGRTVKDSFSARIHAETARLAWDRLPRLVPAIAHELGQQGLGLCDRILMTRYGDV